MTISRTLIALGAAIVLAAINVSIIGKERVIRDGSVVFLELAPRDPRSLLQGDYMGLRFRLAQDIQSGALSGLPSEGLPREGETRLADIVLDERRIGTLAGAGATPNARIRYRMRKGEVWLGTNAFFFEEGTEGRYNPARYGEFRLDPNTGEAVLVALRDANLKPL